MAAQRARSRVLGTPCERRPCCSGRPRRAPASRGRGTAASSAWGWTNEELPVDVRPFEVLRPMPRQREEAAVKLVECRAVALGERLLRDDEEVRVAPLVRAADGKRSVQVHADQIRPEHCPHAPDELGQNAVELGELRPHPHRLPRMTEGTIPFEGGETWYRIVGDAEEPGKLPLLALHGGPGALHDYLEPLEALAGTGRRVILRPDRLRPFVGREADRLLDGRALRPRGPGRPRRARARPAAHLRLVLGRDAGDGVRIDAALGRREPRPLLRPGEHPALGRGDEPPEERSP